MKVRSRSLSPSVARGIGALCAAVFVVSGAQADTTEREAPPDTPPPAPTPTPAGRVGSSARAKSLKQ